MVAAVHVGNNTFKSMFLYFFIATVIIISELNYVITTAIKNELLNIVFELFKGHIHIKLVVLR